MLETLTGSQSITLSATARADCFVRVGRGVSLSASPCRAFYPGGTHLQRWHRALLRRAMEAEGFTVNPEEWGHFDYKDAGSYRIGNLAFDKIK